MNDFEVSMWCLLILVTPMTSDLTYMCHPLYYRCPLLVWPWPSIRVPMTTTMILTKACTRTRVTMTTMKTTLTPRMDLGVNTLNNTTLTMLLWMVSTLKAGNFHATFNLIVFIMNLKTFGWFHFFENLIFF